VGIEALSTPLLRGCGVIYRNEGSDCLHVSTEGLEVAGVLHPQEHLHDAPATRFLRVHWMLQDEVLIGRPGHLPVGFPRPGGMSRIVGGVGLVTEYRQ
jgi:hypothetical protein